LAYPDHIFSFGLTLIGLLALTLYTVYFAKKSIGAKSLAELDFRKVGAIVTAVGMYFLVLYVMWLFLGTDAKWSTWYAWLLGHNMDLWALSLPLVGVPLMFQRKSANQDS
jgi:magnesium-transporting ATPase (P-type)